MQQNLRIKDFFLTFNFYYLNLHDILKFHLMLKTAITILLIALMQVIIGSCSTSTTTSKLITIDDYSFARASNDNQLETIGIPAVYERGETVHFVLFNVGPFKKDDSGLNWFDIDVEITGPDGEVILSETGLLGDGGHLKLENDIASSPEGTFSSTPDMVPGKYKFKMTIYDRIGKGRATQTASFTLK